MVVRKGRGCGAVPPLRPTHRRVEAQDGVGRDVVALLAVSDFNKGRGYDGDRFVVELRESLTSMRSMTATERDPLLGDL